jgi:hypothetical protein
MTYLALLATLVAPLAVALPQVPLQKPLLSSDETSVRPLLREPTVTQPNASICDAGSSQWAGRVPVQEGREMFFCMTLPSIHADVLLR